MVIVTGASAAPGEAGASCMSVIGRPPRWRGGCGGQLVRELRGLLPQLRRGRRVDVGEQLLGVRLCVGHDGRAKLGGDPLGVGVRLGVVAFVQRLLGRQPGAQPEQRIAGDPRLHLVGGAVAGRVVRVGVRLHPVGQRLHERWTTALARLRHGLPQHREQRGQVVAVDEPAAHPVADALVGDAGRGGLPAERHRDGVAVVLHEEDHRQVEDGGEVERLVEVALAGGAVAAEREHDGVLAAHPSGVREADRVQQLGRERRGLRGDVVDARVVSGVPVAAEQHERLERVDAALDDGDGVAVGREQPILIVQHHGGGDLAGLLPVRRRIDGELALPHQRIRLVVDPAREDQPPVPVEQGGGGRDRVPVVGVVTAVLVDEPQRGVAGQQIVRVHLFSFERRRSSPG
ncbi:hypothetical protein A0130_06380 [Leifsonia xyli]|nr:hypothetical protein A0130_06380 [Leifsonia xyli]